MMYVRTSDLVVIDPADPGCLDPVTGLPLADPLAAPTCPVRLSDTAPVEPIALRANAGDCIETTLRNRIPAVAPDLAGWQDMMWIVKRRIQVDPVTGIAGDALLQQQPDPAVEPRRSARPAGRVRRQP